MATYYFRNSNGNWNAASSWSLTDGGPAGGSVPTSADDAYFTSNSGSCTVNTNGMVCKTLIFSGVGAGSYTNTFTLTNTLAVSGDITLSSSMTFAGTSTITVNAASTITTNGKVFTCSMSTSGTITVTLGDDVYVSGNFTIGGAVGSIATINSNTLYLGANLTGFGTIISGTSNVTMNGTGTISVSSFNGAISGTGNFTFNTNGTITINTSVFSSSGRTISYVAGNVAVPKGQSITFQVSGSGIMALDLKGVQFFGSVTMASQGSFSLVSDLIIDGASIIFGAASLSGSQPLVVNSSGGNLYLGWNSMPFSISSGSANLTSISGTATIYIKGGGTGTWNGFYQTILNNLVFDFNGILKFINGTLLGNEQNALTLSTGTYTFLNGRITSENFRGVKNQGRLSIIGSGTFIGFDKMSGFGNIQISNGLTLTMDKFFSGRPDCILNIFCATTTGAYTITFQDGFEKFANWIKLSNCTITNRGQLLVLNQKALTNTGRNTGVRYINSLPNGIPEKSPIVAGAQMAFGASGLVSDPAIAL